MFARVYYFAGKDFVSLICFLILQACFIFLPCMADGEGSEQETFLTRYDTSLVHRAKLLLAYDELQKTSPRYPNIVTNWIPSFTSVVWGVKFDCLSDDGREYGTEWSRIYRKTLGEKSIGVVIVALDSAVKAHEYLIFKMCAPSHGMPNRRCEVISEKNKIGFRCFQYSIGDQLYYVEFIRNNIWLKIEGTGFAVEPLARDLDRQILELSHGIQGGSR
jgi:hypothetical protein